MTFALNTQFDDWKKVLETKKLYEESSKTVLTIRKCDKLKGTSELNDKIVYERVTLHCKAGHERPSQSRGFRESSTYKKNCPVKVTYKNDMSLFVIKSEQFLRSD